MGASAPALSVACDTARRRALIIHALIVGDSFASISRVTGSCEPLGCAVARALARHVEELAPGTAASIAAGCVARLMAA